jgi:hypothetical protein
MKGKILLLAGVVSLSILAVSGFILLSENTAPEEYVQKITRESREDFFFKKDIIRHPARANITYPQLENQTIKVGVSADTHELNFGLVIQNMTVRKFLNLRTGDVNVKVCVVPYGSIKQFIEIEQNDFVMKTNESKQIMVEFSGDRVGSYTGEIDVIVKKPKHDFLEPLLLVIPC